MASYKPLVRQPSVVDYGTLANVLDNKFVFPSDIDGILERKGQFLVIETKKQGIELTQGQSIMFRKMAKLPQFTVFVVWITGDTTPAGAEWFIPTSFQRIGKDDKPVPTTLKDFRQIYKAWFDKADKR